MRGIRDILSVTKGVLFRKVVGVTDTTRLDLDDDLALSRRRQRNFFNDQLTTSLLEGGLFGCFWERHCSAREMGITINRGRYRSKSNWLNKEKANIESPDSRKR